MKKINLKDIESGKEQIALNELDTSYTKTIFDVNIEVGPLNYYFRCTKINNNMDTESEIEFLEEDSDRCESKAMEFMKDRITEVYL